MGSRNSKSKSKNQPKEKNQTNSESESPKNSNLEEEERIENDPIHKSLHEKFLAVKNKLHEKNITITNELFSKLSFNKIIIHELGEDSTASLLQEIFDNYDEFVNHAHMKHFEYNFDQLLLNAMKNKFEKNAMILINQTKIPKIIFEDRLEGKSAMEIAIDQDSANLVALLLNRDKEKKFASQIWLDQIDKLTGSPLIYALYKNANYFIIQELALAGYDHYLHSKEDANLDISSLSYFAGHANPKKTDLKQIFAVLRSLYHNVDIEDKQQKTPIMYALHHEIIRLFLYHGASTSKKDSNGRNALEAIIINNKESELPFALNELKQINELFARINYFRKFLAKYGQDLNNYKSIEDKLPLMDYFVMSYLKPENNDILSFDELDCKRFKAFFDMMQEHQLGNKVKEFAGQFSYWRKGQVEKLYNAHIMNKASYKKPDSFWARIYNFFEGLWPFSYISAFYAEYDLFFLSDNYTNKDIGYYLVHLNNNVREKLIASYDQYPADLKKLDLREIYQARLKDMPSEQELDRMDRLADERRLSRANSFGQLQSPQIIGALHDRLVAEH